MLLADRFLRVRDSWFDIATALPVRVLITDAGPRPAQIAWAERCAMLLRLRHPLINPLIDFGAGSPAALFEAYAVRETMTLSKSSASLAIPHARRFLAAHGVELAGAAEDAAIRPVAHARDAREWRPVGVVLQSRRAEVALVDLLCEPGARGTTAVRIVAAPGSGLRTLLTTVAHLARRDGYVPVCARALLRWPTLVDMLARRHVCLLANQPATVAEREAITFMLVRLAMHSARSHVCLTFHRGLSNANGDVRLEPMGMTTMSTMAYIDPHLGPSADEILRAARKSEGIPARFLVELGAHGFDPQPPRHVAVHEAHAEYRTVETTEGGSAPTVEYRLASVLGRAGGRARVLEARGRHGAASRLLARAARVLEGRRLPDAAAQCWLQLAWLTRNRGAVDAALAYADRARRATGSAGMQIDAGCLTAVCWTDALRFIDAEAHLRTLLASPHALEATTSPERCTLALARVLHLQERYAEAGAVVAPLARSRDERIGCEAQFLIARAFTGLGELPRALSAAREGARRAGETPDFRLRASAARACAEALCAAGDVDGVRRQVTTGLESAALAHLPLAALRLRAILLRSLLTALGPCEESARLGAALARALSRPLPPLLRRTVEAARSAAHSSNGRQPWSGHADATSVEAFLEIAQRSKDDLAAIGEVAMSLCERIGAQSVAVVSASDNRVVATAGKPWRDRSAAGAQALASGRPVGFDDSIQPHEAAEPIRCGGELIGVITCRWVLGATAVPASVGSALKAAGMAIAAHLRVVTDNVPAEPPPAAWGDLLGDSDVAAALREAVVRASRAPFPVLIEGESGSGKELVARAIHRLSARHARKFCAINCAALSDDLIEAELFGHARGAFTGAMTERPGLFEEADGGTLFLDEVGELAARAQAKLLRVLQEGEVRRVGENLPRRVDVRIVAATNRHLQHEAAQGRFRTDLRFRLDVLRITVPPLRERITDIPILAQHFWRQACSRVGTSAVLGPDTLSALSRYDWPGNVRELQNTMAWMAVHAPRRGRVSSTTLPAQLATQPLSTGSFEAAREEFERRFVRAALAQAGGQRQIAARALGVSRQGLAKMMRRLGIETSAARS